MDANVMSVGGCYYSSNPASYEAEEEMGDIRKGPWTAEEDLLLTNYIHIYGEGRWNSLARSAGLNRTGKSCRLRWLNYLRPDVRRGNISPQEQLLILQLHTRWGNRWSKIAQYLPGRTDNEIKNYWRTRVQKQAKQLKCDVNSKQFRDTMRYVWIPRLAERIRAESGSSTATATQPMGSTNNDFIGHPNYHYKSDGSSESSSEVTQVRRPDLCMTDGYNIGARVQYEPKSACGPEEFGGSSPSGGYGKEEMDLDYPCLNLEQSDISDIGWLAGEDSSIKDTDNMTWNNEEIYDDLDAWLGDE